MKGRKPDALHPLAFCSPFISADLAYTRGWRVRYALIRCFAILQPPASDGRISKTPVQPAHLPGHMVLHHLPLHPQEADVKGSRPLRGIWNMSGLAEHSSAVHPTPPSHPFSRLSRLIPQASAQLYPTSGHITRASGALNTPSSVEDMSSTITKCCYFGLMLHSVDPIPPSINELFPNSGPSSSIWKICLLLEGFVQSLKKNHRYKQLIRVSH